MTNKGKSCDHVQLEDVEDAKAERHAVISIICKFGLSAAVDLRTYSRARAAAAADA